MLVANVTISTSAIVKNKKILKFVLAFRKRSKIELKSRSCDCMRIK